MIDSEFRKIIIYYHSWNQQTEYILNVSLNHKIDVNDESFYNDLFIFFQLNKMIMLFLQKFLKQFCKLIFTSQMNLYVNDFDERDLKWIVTCKRKILQDLKDESQWTVSFNQVMKKSDQIILIKRSLKIEI